MKHLLLLRSCVKDDRTSLVVNFSSLSHLCCTCELASLTLIILSFFSFRIQPLITPRVPPLLLSTIQYLVKWPCLVWQCPAMDSHPFSTRSTCRHKLISSPGLIHLLVLCISPNCQFFCCYTLQKLEK